MPDYTSHATIRLFADDTIAYLTVSSVEDCIKLQEDLAMLGKMGTRLADGIPSKQM